MKKVIKSNPYATLRATSIKAPFTQAASRASKVNNPSNTGRKAGM